MAHAEACATGAALAAEVPAAEVPAAAVPAAEVPAAAVPGTAVAAATLVAAPDALLAGLGVAVPPSLLTGAAVAGGTLVAVAWMGTLVSVAANVGGGTLVAVAGTGTFVGNEVVEVACGACCDVGVTKPASTLTERQPTTSINPAANTDCAALLYVRLHMMFWVLCFHEMKRSLVSP